MARRIKCRPMAMPEVFKWGDTTPNWDDSVDEYMAVQRFNRLCQSINRRGRSNKSDPQS